MSKAKTTGSKHDRLRMQNNHCRTQRPVYEMIIGNSLQQALAITSVVPGANRKISGIP